MKFFVTGATGYIGEHLVFELLGRNHEVVALVRSPEKASGLIGAGVTCVTGDLHSIDKIEDAMKGCDGVFHLAAYASVWPEEDSTFVSVNVEGTRNILNSAAENNVKKVVITSTAGVYGPSDSPAAPVDESTVRTLPFFNAYEATKAKSEEIARAFAREGLDVVIVNPARVYGPGKDSESNAIGKLIKLYQSGKWRFIPGNGKRTGSYCYISDVVEGHIRAMEKGRSGENYLFGGENISYEQFFGTLQSVCGKKEKLYHVPLRAMVNASALMVLWAKMTDTKPLITPKWVRKYMYDWSVSSQKAVDELGYPVTPFVEGMKRTLNGL